MTTERRAQPAREPKRIQRKRAKGWRMPDGAVYVGRPTVWGNSFRVGIDGSAEQCVARYRNRILENIWSVPNKARIKEELAGKDLACWCPLDKPCHADVLLEIANAGSPAPSSGSGKR